MEIEETPDIEDIADDENFDASEMSNLFGTRDNALLLFRVVFAILCVTVGFSLFFAMDIFLAFKDDFMNVRID